MRRTPARCGLSSPPGIVSPELRGDEADTSLRPQSWTSSSASRRRAPISRYSSRRHADAAKRSTMCCSSARPPRQDDAGADHGARARRQFPLHLRPGDRQGRRSRRPAHQPRGSRRPLHRRGPPAESGRRGDPLSGNGGFPARPDHRRRPGGALGQDRPGAVHPGRRHHEAGPAHQTLARPLGIPVG